LTFHIIHFCFFQTGLIKQALARSAEKQKDFIEMKKKMEEQPLKKLKPKGV
jgi:hypothetical protein